MVAAPSGTDGTPPPSQTVAAGPTCGAQVPADLYARLALDAKSACRTDLAHLHAWTGLPTLASNSSKRVGAGCGDVFLMRLSGLVSRRIGEDVRE